MEGFEDIWRFGISVLSLLCLFILISRFRRNRTTYNAKTLDLWFALVAWCAAGLIGPFCKAVWETSSPGLLMTTFAVLVSLKGVKAEGKWGANDG